jgi:outer membrane protein assembly factor BamB
MLRRSQEGVSQVVSQPGQIKEGAASHGSLHSHPPGRGRLALVVSLLAVASTGCWDSPTEGRWGGIHVWSYTESGGAVGEPYMDAELVVVAKFESDTLIALNRETGTRVWARRLDLPEGPFGQPHLVGTERMLAFENLLIVPSLIVVAVDRETGEKVWTLGPPDPWDYAGRSIVLGDGRLFAAGSELYAVDPATGSVLWHRDFGEVHNGLLYEDGILYAGGAAVVGGGGTGPQPLGEGHVRAVDAETGDLIWEYFVPNHPQEPWLGGVMARGALTQELLLVAGRNGFVYGLEKDTGELRWAHEAPRPVGSTHNGVALAGDVVVVGLSGSGEARGIDPETGELLWSVPMGSSVFDVSTVGNLALVVNGRMTALDAAGTEVWGFGGAGWGQPTFMRKPAIHEGLMVANSVVSGVHAVEVPW